MASEVSVPDWPAALMFGAVMLAMFAIVALSLWEER